MRCHPTCRALAAVVALYLLAVVAPDVRAESDTAAERTEPDPLAEAAITARRKDVAGELAVRRAALEALGQNDAARAPVDLEIAALERVERILDDQLRTARDHEPSDQPTDELRIAASIDELASLHALRERIRQRSDALHEAVEATTRAIEGARKSFETKDRMRREARDAKGTVAPHERHLREIEAQEAREVVRLRELEVRADRLALGLQAERAAELERLIAESTAQLRQAVDLPLDLSALDARTGQIDRALKGLDRDLATAELKLSQAKGRYERATDPPASLLDEVETLSLARDALEERAAVLRDEQGRLERRRTTLERWQRALRGQADREQLTAWRQEAEQHAADVKLQITQRQGRLEEVRSRTDALRLRLDPLPASDPARPLLQRRLDVLTEIARAVETDLKGLKADQTLVAGAAAAIQEETGHVPFRERVATVVQVAAGAWRYEVTVIDDEGITVGEIFLAILLLGVGVALSRRLSHGFASILLRRSRLDPGASTAIETLLFYLLLVGFTLFALRTVNFPLTAFTIAGGALAIGIGFGSQNIMNNFISGLILMLERPVRAGDLVEIAGTHGTVERIGPRSTTIRATDMTHMVVPNSFFLENTLVNWTLSDDVIRSVVGVGVVYGSPTRDVERILLEVLSTHSRVLEHPKPIIVFAEFGDNSLNFEAYFWTRARSPMAVRRVASDIRFKIDDLFREAGIVIAFPQRDVHIDGVGPLEVRVLQGPPPAPEG
jgi:small-conductance mechanosensitive channel